MIINVPAVSNCFCIVPALIHGDLFAAQTTANWKADWDATQRAAEKEGRLVIYGPTGVDQQKLYTEVFQQTFPKIKVNYTPGRISEIISSVSWPSSAPAFAKPIWF